MYACTALQSKRIKPVVVDKNKEKRTGPFPCSSSFSFKIFRNSSGSFNICEFFNCLTNLWMYQIKEDYGWSNRWKDGWFNMKSIQWEAAKLRPFGIQFTASAWFCWLPLEAIDRLLFFHLQLSKSGLIVSAGHCHLTFVKETVSIQIEPDNKVWNFSLYIVFGCTS